MSSPIGETPRGGEYASPAEIQLFVLEALAAFAAHENEFMTPESDAEAPIYTLSDITYDPLVTPHLEPFETAHIDAADLSVMRGPSHVEASFIIPIFKDHGVRRLYRTISFWNNGEIDDVTRDYAHEARTLDPEEPTKPASSSREDIHAWVQYMSGKEALRNALDQAEGLPVGPPRISRAELDDISKLLPFKITEGRK